MDLVSIPGRPDFYPVSPEEADDSLHSPLPDMVKLTVALKAGGIGC